MTLFCKKAHAVKAMDRAKIWLMFAVADGFVVRMMMWQNSGEKCHFDNVRVISLL